MLKKKRKIILAPPYSGSLYTYFNDCIALDKMDHINHMDHPYYSRLYGMYTEQSKDVAVTLSILYDEIIIPPEDSYYPNNGLGFNISWDEFQPFLHDNQEELSEYMMDKELSDLLKNGNDYDKKLLISQLNYCIYLSEKLSCPIFCGQGTKKIIDRMSEIKRKQTSDSSLNKTAFLEEYLTLLSFAFDVTDLDVFEKVKHNSSIRNYCNKFIKILEKKADKTTTETQLKQLIQESINKNDVFDNIKGVLKISSLLFGVGGLIPDVGTPCSISSLISTGCENLISRKAPDWYELAPKIKQISKLELLKKNANSPFNN